MDKFDIRLDKNSPLSQHRQLALALNNLFERKIIGGNEYLPGERTLAKHLGITRDVVHRAYKILHDQGLIEFSNHKGHRLISNLT